MAIDKQIYNNGIKGLLSYYEIQSLPADYEIYKGMFKEATQTRENNKNKTKNVMDRTAMDTTVHTRVRECDELLTKCKKSRTMPTKLGELFGFFKLFNRLNKRGKHPFFRQFSKSYITRRHYALMQAIDFVRVRPYDIASNELNTEEAKAENAFRHSLEIQQNNLKVPDIDNALSFARTNTENKKITEYFYKKGMKKIKL